MGDRVTEGMVQHSWFLNPNFDRKNSAGSLASPSRKLHLPEHQININKLPPLLPKFFLFCKFQLWLPHCAPPESGGAPPLPSKEIENVASFV